MTKASAGDASPNKSKRPNKPKTKPDTKSSRRRLTSVRVPKTAELVARELRRRIIHGELNEGDSLPPESALIEEFGISRPTMREAFRILETEQLISVSRGSRGGARVHLPKVDLVARYAGLYLQSRNTTLGDVFKARMIIEPASVRLLAERRPARVLKELHALLDEVETHIEDHEAFSHFSAQFHLKLVEGSGNETLALIANVMHHIVEAHLLNVTGKRYDTDLAKLGVRSEKKLLQLVEAGDGDAAQAHMTRHLERSGRVVLRHAGSKSIVEVLPG
ncbi:MAG: FadR/GntR family transcriptional regulator [Pseudomonadota bacterium]